VRAHHVLKRQVNAVRAGGNAFFQGGLEFRRDFAGGNDRRFCHEHHSFNQVFQLADIAGPSVAQETIFYRIVQTTDIQLQFFVEFFNKLIHQG